MLEGHLFRQDGSASTRETRGRVHSDVRAAYGYDEFGAKYGMLADRALAGMLTELGPQATASEWQTETFHPHPI
jgi:hypothetical protein